MAVVFALSTIATYVALCVYSTAGLQRVNLGAFERYGEVMSGVFIIGIILSLAGLLVPIPLMALDLLIGTIQAYIFTVLAMVFIGSAVSEGHSGDSKEGERL